MDWSGLTPTLLDAVLVVVALLSLRRGWRLGAVVRTSGALGLVAGLLAGAWAAPRVAEQVLDDPDGGTAATLTLVLLVVGLSVGQSLGLRLGLPLRRLVHRGGRPAVTADRSVGVPVSLAATAVTVWLVTALFVQGPVPELSAQIEDSEVVGALGRTLGPPPAPVVRAADDLGRLRLPTGALVPGGGITAPPVPPTADDAVRAATDAGRPGTVRVRAAGCGARIGSGSGFVAAPGFVVTNAHVVDGFGALTVQDTEGSHDADPVLVDRALDVAVLAVPDLTAPALPWRDDPAGRGDEGASLGFPGGTSTLTVTPGTVRTRIDFVGGAVGGVDPVRREVLVLQAAVEQGDSGGPFLTADGRVAGVIFAGAPDGAPTAYALTTEQVRPAVDDAIARDEPVSAGPCTV